MAGERTAGWTCGECGMAFADYGPEELVAEARRTPERWRAAVEPAGEAQLRTRPDPATWSAIEYGGHLVDVTDWMVSAFARMREADHPEVAWYDHEGAVTEHGYAERPVDEVSARLRDRTRALTATLEDVDDWSRAARFPWGDRDVLDMARNAVHEHVHHLGDVERVLDRVR